ncbi:MAG: hypothetical protein IJO48_06845, partial [Clostridia bacterium]|nr:hypothetical protein [Clostridia bacterium]
SMLVENHGGIYEFFEHNIRLKGDSGIISISGSSLVLLEINPERLYISGCINSVELE